MNSIQEECIHSCIHDDQKFITDFEFDNEKFTKSLCQKWSSGSLIPRS